MDTKHVCPKCGLACGWHGPPFEGRWAKLRAIAFRVRRRTLFSRNSRKYPFLRCLNCGYVATFEEWTNLKREGEDEHIVERLERREFYRNHVEPHLTKPKSLGDIRAVRQMKHGHQASWYRKSVKSNIKPDEEDN